MSRGPPVGFIKVILLFLCISIGCTRAETVLHIGAAVPFYGTDGHLIEWGQGAARAYQLAVEDLNSDLPRDATYSFATLPVCNTALSIPKGFHCAVYLSGLNRSLQQRPVGILGAGYSSVTMQMLPITTQQKVLQCSWISTSADLSDFHTYPFFMRTVPPDDERATAILTMIVAFGWKRAVLVHTTDRYAGSLAEKFRFKAAERGQGSKTITLTVMALEQEFNEIKDVDKLARLRRDVTGMIWQSQTRIVVAVTATERDMYLLIRWATEDGLIGSGWAWVGVDEFSLLPTSAVLARLDAGELGFSRANLTGSFMVTMREVTTATSARMRAAYFSRYNDSEIPAYAYLAYDCVKAIGLAVAEVLRVHPHLNASDLVNMGFDSMVQEELMTAALNLKYEGASGNVSFEGPSAPAAGDRVSTYSISMWSAEDGVWEEKAIYDETSDPPLVVTGEIRFSNGLTTLSDASPGCPAGQEVDARVIGRYTCRPCPAGRYKSQAGGDSCLSCQAGFACPVNSSSMQPCPAGKHSSQGSEVCSDCPAGTSSSEAATVLCKVCSPGFFQASEGQTVCLACVTGSFQEAAGSTECESCAPTLATNAPGTATRAGCGCPAGHRLVSDRGECMECQVGLNCTDFNATPRVARGFYMRAGAPRDEYFVDMFKCRMPTFCPGQRHPQDPQCEQDRTGLNCGLCAPGLYNRLDSCTPCTGFQTAMLPVALLASLLMCGFLEFFWNSRHEESEDSGWLSLSLTAGTTIAVVQKLGVLSKIDIDWPSGSRNVMQVCAHLLDVLLPATQCAVSPRLLSQYLLRVCIPHFFLLAFTFWWLLSRRLHQWCGRIHTISVYQWANTLGLFLSAVYIYATMGVLTLVDCYVSPNGKRTVREFSFAPCSGPEFAAALPVFVGGVLFYMVGVVGAALYIVWVAPRRYKTGSGFCVMVHFLVYKFRPEKYWFALVTLLSAFLLSLVTVVFPDSDFLQLLSTNLVLCVFLLLICTQLPFRLGLANRVEIIEQAGLIAVVSLGLCFYEMSSAEQDVLSYAISILISGMAGVLALAFGWHIYQQASSWISGQSDAEREKEQLQRQLNIIIEGCQRVVAQPNTFKEVFTKGASYVERDSAAQLMEFFHRALSANSDLVRKTNSRLFLSLRNLNREDLNMKASEEDLRTSTEDQEWASHQWEDNSEVEEKPVVANSPTTASRSDFVSHNVTV